MRKIYPFRLGPLLHTWCLLPGSIGGTRIVFALVSILTYPSFVLSILQGRYGHLLFRKWPHIPLNQCELKLSVIPSPPTAPREINSLDCMALPGKMLKNRFQESCWGPVDHQTESFFLQVLGEKVVALERLWAFASDTLQPLLFILFFILQVYLMQTQRCKTEEMLVVIWRATDI